MVNALEKLTNQSLAGLYFLSWKDVIPSSGLIRNTKAWCSVCLQEWKGSAKTIYEPLIWTLQTVQMCPKHLIMLTKRCSNNKCGKQNLQLNTNSIVGYCYNCGDWLGKSLEEYRELGITDDQQNFVWDSFVSQQICDLITRSSEENVPILKRERISHILTHMLNTHYNGNISEFARLLPVHRRTLGKYLAGVIHPQIDMLILFSKLLQVDLCDLLYGDLDKIKYEYKDDESFHLFRNSKPRPVPLDMVETQKYLESVINSSNTPPPSMNFVAQQLSRNATFIYRYFPEYCKIISSRFLEHQRNKAKNDQQTGFIELRKVMIGIIKVGKYPLVRIEKELQRPGLFMKEPYKAERLKIMNEFGIRRRNNGSEPW
ncbi:TniQ family protein [Brevibacillus sp. NPDC003359]|uniref:TniQ family protein n=1 Tax=unclassified Brevibacillus TaxID=2684853 RepID=UPI0036AFCC75